MANNLFNKPRKTTVSLILAAACTLIPAFLLLIASSWCADDYQIAKLYQLDGLNGLYERIFAWSPRFFSEIVLYLYYNSVPWLGKPFTGGMLLIIWLLLLTAIFNFTQDTIKQNSLLLNRKNKTENIYLQVLLPLLITLIIFIYLLYGARPKTIFYLVVISVPYLVTLAGIIFNINFFINHSDSPKIVKTDIAKLILFGFITSCSWELGAIYQLCFSTSLFLILILNYFLNNFNFLPFCKLNKTNKIQLLIANFIPLLASLYVLLLLLSNRVGSVEANNFESSVAGNFTSSFIHAVRLFFKEILFLSKTKGEFYIYIYSFTYNILYKLGFLLLVTTLFYQAKVKLNSIKLNSCILAILPLIITNFAISFSGYYQLGTISLPRQISFRSGLLGLIIVISSLMIASLALSKNNKLTDILNLLLNKPKAFLINFGLTLTLLVGLQLSHLVRDMSNFQNLVVSNHRNWQINLNSNSSFAIYTQISSSYIYRMYLDDGLYPACNNGIHSNASRYMNYFNKQKLYVTPFKDHKLDNYFEKIFEEVNILDNKTQVYFDCSVALGNIDKINEVINQNQVIDAKVSDPIELLGWAINPNRSKAKRIIITKENDKNILINIPVNIPRPDVAKFLNNPSVINSGWKAVLTPNSEWNGQTITFKVWTYDPDTKIADFFQKFVLSFAATK